MRRAPSNSHDHAGPTVERRWAKQQRDDGAVPRCTPRRTGSRPRSDAMPQPPPPASCLHHTRPGLRPRDLPFVTWSASHHPHSSKPSAPKSSAKTPDAPIPTHNVPREAEDALFSAIPGPESCSPARNPVLNRPFPARPMQPARAAQAIMCACCSVAMREKGRYINWPWPQEIWAWACSSFSSCRSAVRQSIQSHHGGEE